VFDFIGWRLGFDSDGLARLSAIRISIFLGADAAEDFRIFAFNILRAVAAPSPRIYLS